MYGSIKIEDPSYIGQAFRDSDDNIGTTCYGFQVGEKFFQFAMYRNMPAAAYIYDITGKIIGTGVAKNCGSLEQFQEVLRSNPIMPVMYVQPFVVKYDDVQPNHNVFTVSEYTREYGQAGFQELYRQMGEADGALLSFEDWLTRGCEVQQLEMDMKVISNVNVSVVRIDPSTGEVFMSEDFAITSCRNLIDMNLAEEVAYEAARAMGYYDSIDNLELISSKSIDM